MLVIRLACADLPSVFGQIKAHILCLLLIEIDLLPLLEHSWLFVATFNLLSCLLYISYIILF